MQPGIGQSVCPCVRVERRGVSAGPARCRLFAGTPRCRVPRSALRWQGLAFSHKCVPGEPRSARRSTGESPSCRSRQPWLTEPASGRTWSRVGVMFANFGSCQGIEMTAQGFHRVERPKVPCVNVCDSGAGGVSQGLETRRGFCLPVLHQAEALSQHFTRVLVTAGPDHAVDEPGLMIGKDDVARRHFRIALWRIMPMEHYRWQGRGGEGDQGLRCGRTGRRGCGGLPARWRPCGAACRSSCRPATRAWRRPRPACGW